jgi:hypothetical protein
VEVKVGEGVGVGKLTVNFINVILAQFSYEILAPKTRFCTKKARVKC